MQALKRCNTLSAGRHYLSSGISPRFVVTADAPGNWKSAYSLLGDVVDAARSAQPAQVQSADATNHPLPDETAGVWFTDPPYYDAIPYSDLSDFFLVWLKRTLPDNPLLRDPFDPDNPLSPKMAEAVQDETKQVDGRSKDRVWFEETMARAFDEAGGCCARTV